MDEATKEAESESLPIGVFELEGEPAILINGVPDVSPNAENLVPSSAVADTESRGNTGLDSDLLGNKGFGEWFIGRGVQKLFAGRNYIGTITHFDPENGWYRVEYEDGDSEDLDWPELEEILLPLDIQVPLKTLALKVAKKDQKTVPTSGKGSTWSQSIKSKEAHLQG